VESQAVDDCYAAGEAAAVGDDFVPSHADLEAERESDEHTAYLEQLARALSDLPWDHSDNP
jgi:hypothetical protein